MAKQIGAAAAPKTNDQGFVETRTLQAADRGQRAPDYGERRRMFFLSAHPSSVELVETSKGWRLVPVLKRLIVQAGVNFTKSPERDGGSLDASDIEAKFRGRFGHDVLVNQSEYLVVADGINNTKGYFLRWERIKAYADGSWEIQMDNDGYDLWRWSLITGGQVEAPRDSVIDQVRSRLKKAVARSTRTPHLMQAQEAKAAAEKRLAGLDEAIKALAALTAKPKRAPIEAPNEEAP